MSENKTGGPAFPPMHNLDTHHSGMTLRDWFAGQALAGMNAADRRWVNGKAAMATAAYAQADAMLALRNTELTGERNDD